MTEEKLPQNPIQPLVTDKHGVLRFKANKIVKMLLDRGSLNMNDIAEFAGVSRDDRIQFAQLIGYSLCGFGDLSYADEVTYATASRMHENGISETEARNNHLEETLHSVQEKLREGVAELYEICSEDL